LCSRCTAITLNIHLPIAAGRRFAHAQWHAGDNVGTGKDYTLFSTIDGVVVYQKKSDRSKVRPRSSLHVVA